MKLITYLIMKLIINMIMKLITNMILKVIIRVLIIIWHEAVTLAAPGCLHSSISPHRDPHAVQPNLCTALHTALHTNAMHCTAIECTVHTNAMQCNALCFLRCCATQPLQCTALQVLQFTPTCMNWNAIHSNSTPLCTLCTHSASAHSAQYRVAQCKAHVCMRWTAQCAVEVACMQGLPCPAPLAPRLISTQAHHLHFTSTGFKFRF